MWARSPRPKGLQRSRMNPKPKPKMSGMAIQSLKTANSLAWRCIRFFKKKLTGRSIMPASGPEKFISTSSRPPNAKAWTRRRPERPAEGPVTGAGSVELIVVITSHAQDGSETDHFSLEIFRLFSGSRGQAQNLARLHRRFAKEGPQAADGLATSGEERPQHQRLAPLNHPQGRIPTPMPGTGGYRGKLGCTSSRRVSRKRFLK